MSVSPHRRTRLLNVSMDNCTLADALDDVGAAIDARLANGPQQFAFVNADCLNVAWTNPEYAALLGRLGRVFPDGSGIRWVARFLHRERMLDNVNGTDLFPLLCRRAEAEGWSVALLGAEPEVVARLVQNLAVSSPRLNVVFASDGYFRDRSEAASIAAIAEARPDVLLVAMGAPRQELWIDRHLHELDAAVCLGVGGLFDFYSETVARAPMPIRRIGMEWLWRMAQEPGRLWRRYLLGNPKFIARAIRNRKVDRVAPAD